MAVYQLDPLEDRRWRNFVSEQPNSSVFHTAGWLEALRQTYGYKPLVLTTCRPGRDLTNGLVFCRITSRLTGRRLVSLPFSDHCEPLVGNADDTEQLLCCLEDILEKEDLKYIEIRPISGCFEGQADFVQGKQFWFHKIELGPSLDDLFRSFHRDCVQRKIRRAEREALDYEAGRSDSLLRQFYHLLLLTRRRQQLPPQPVDWFRNLIACLGDKIKIYVASKGGLPVASVVTLCHKDVLVYKYGASDTRFSRFGGTQLLLWRIIQEGNHDGIREFDLGRSDLDHPGLVTFKDRWGSRRSTLTYWRYPAPGRVDSTAGWTMRAARQVLARMPDGVFAMAGKLLCKHVA